MASAAFTINGGATPQSAAASSTVNLALTSITGARLIEWSIIGWSDSAKSKPTITPAGSPSGATASFSIGTESLTGLGLSWVVQCRINGGVDDAGQVVAAYTQTGIVGILNGNGYLPFSVGERYERNATHGIADNLNRELLLAANGGVVVAATGNVNPAVSGTLYDFQADLSSAATITCNASPSAGNSFAVKAPSNASIKNVTIDGNGKQIDGASTFVLDVDDMFAWLYYNGTRWRVRQ